MLDIKQLTARLPDRWQATLKRLRYARQIRRGTFATTEPEYARLAEWVRPGAWVVDVGANVGHYTRRLSDLAGPAGRVIAFEPVPATFALLTANTRLFAHANVTLINAAASAATDVVGMSVPKFASGLDNYYEAQIGPSGADGWQVLTLALDSLELARRIALVKIDAEGHEAQVLAGMRRLVARDHPILIVETGSPEIGAGLATQGYTAEKLPGSPNLLFRPPA